VVQRKRASEFGAQRRDRGESKCAPTAALLLRTCGPSIGTIKFARAAVEESGPLYAQPHFLLRNLRTPLYLLPRCAAFAAQLLNEKLRNLCCATSSEPAAHRLTEQPLLLCFAPLPH
jgi:hypothetical protein